VSELLVSYQTPLADLRPFAGGEETRLTRPHWGSPPDGANEFVRGFGALRVRRSRDDLGTDERVFCDARRAVRFPPDRGPWLFRHAQGAPIGRLRLGWRSRRVYPGAIGAGSPVMRVDLGFRRTSDPSETALEPESLRRLPELCLRSQLEVRPDELGAEWRRVPLMAIGKPLARLLLSSTTARTGGAAAGAPFLSPGRAMLVVELYADHAPTPARSTALRFAEGEGLGLRHCQLEMGAYRPHVWFITGPPSAARSDVARRLRQHLARIHAEHECLMTVLRWASNAKLDDSSVELVGDYLDRAFELQRRSRRNGFSQDEVLEEAYRLDGDVNADEHDDRDAMVERLPAKLRRRVDKAKEAPGFVMW